MGVGTGCRTWHLVTENVSAWWWGAENRRGGLDLREVSSLWHNIHARGVVAGHFKAVHT